ncbi:MAG: sugar phosphate isomerase/epimerase [Sedimentisphaerales bacterium]|nr:sugar phosphate isomerase/epimerase [Sedimentisphaerales bacterium]
MAKLSAFSDEVARLFLGQVQFLTAHDINYIELRFIDGKNILELNKSELKEIKYILDDHDIKVSAIGSPIGKVRIDEPFNKHLDKFKVAVDSALFFDTPYIRMFSYYPPEGETIEDYRSEIMDRMAAKVAIIQDSALTMVHENETDIYGHTAQNCVDLVQTVDSPHLRLAYDPGNFVWGEKITDPIASCWPLMKPYVVHVHIKDWKLGAQTGSIPGQGDGQIKELLAELAAMNYKGCLTLEPHLKEGKQFFGASGAELFTHAVEAIRKLADKAGLECT